MVVKLNNGAVREIKKAEPIVEKRFTFNGDTLRMVAKANSSKEDITGILFKLKDGRDDDISVFAEIFSIVRCREFWICFLLKAM